MTLEAIKEAIEPLPPEQLALLADWISERDWQTWDEQTERDFPPGGAGIPLLAEAEIGRRVDAFPKAELDQVAGSLRWKTKPKTLAEMDGAVEREVNRRHHGGRY